MAVASKGARPRAAFKPLQRNRTSRCALLAAAAAASWVWQTVPALAQGAPKVRIITGSGDFMVDLRPATATTGPAAEPQPTASSEQISAASPTGALPTTLTPAPSLLPLLAQEPVAAPAPTAGHQARKSWEASRRARIASKSQISVTLSDLAIAVQGGVATARFKQHYSAGALNISSRKMLELTQEANERWAIVRETAAR